MTQTLCWICKPLCFFARKPQTLQLPWNDKLVESDAILLDILLHYLTEWMTNGLLFVGIITFLTVTTNCFVAKAIDCIKNGLEMYHILHGKNIVL